MGELDTESRLVRIRHALVARCTRSCVSAAPANACVPTLRLDGQALGAAALRCSGLGPCTTTCNTSRPGACELSQRTRAAVTTRYKHVVHRQSSARVRQRVLCWRVEEGPCARGVPPGHFCVFVAPPDALPCSGAHASCMDRDSGPGSCVEWKHRPEGKVRATVARQPSFPTYRRASAAPVCSIRRPYACSH